MTRTLHRGMTLVELLVAMAIGLVVTLVISTLLVAGENHKRTTTSTNDADQTGSYAFYGLDRALRSAGSAIAESAYPIDRGVLGCRLNVKSLLPRAGAFPAPFGAFLGGTPSDLRVAPVLIGENQSDGGSDVLVVMSGSGAAGGVSRASSGGGDASTFLLATEVGFNTNDIALVSQGGITDCLMTQVTGTSTATLTLGGPYATTTSPSGTDINTLTGSANSYITPLGNTKANNAQFMLFGVGVDNTLYSYDLLQNQKQWLGSGPGDTPQAIADGVVQLKAIYGVLNPATPGIPAWTNPDNAYAIATVMTSPTTMESIVAVHVALVVRGEYYDKNIVSPVVLTIFNGYKDSTGGSLVQPVNLTPDAQHYRYRVFEFTVPLRNMLILAGA